MPAAAQVAKPAGPSVRADVHAGQHGQSKEASPATVRCAVGGASIPVCHPRKQTVLAAMADVRAAAVAVRDVRDALDGTDFCEVSNPYAVAVQLSARLRDALVLLGAAHG